MDGLLGGKAPKKADAGAETAKLRKEREELMARSNIDKNTTSAGTTGGGGQVFRSVLGA